MILSAAFLSGAIFGKAEIMLYTVRWRCINKNHSDMEMKEEGIKEILKLEIAFTGKKVCIKTGKERD